MAIYKSNKKVVAVYKGSTPINKIYKGVTLVFQKSGGGGSTQSIEGTATGNFDLKINNSQTIPITPDADGKWFYDTDEKITNLSYLFGGSSSASKVTSVDLSNLDLSDISTNKMFYNCSKITSIKFNNTKSMKLVDVTNMFYNCSSLVSLDVSNFDTSNLTSANYLFKGCSKLVSLDISNWNTSNLTSAYSLFGGCSSLTSLDLSSFNTSNLQDAGALFSGCSSLTSLDLSSFNTSNLTSAYSLVSGCRSLTSLDLSSFDTSNLQDASYLFENCMALKTLDLSNFDMSGVAHYGNMFLRCYSLNHIKCKQAFKDWCITNQDKISLPDAMREGGSGTWEIIHLFEGTATGNFNMTVNGNNIPIAPDASGKWFYDTNEKITDLDYAFSYQMAVTSVDLSNLDLTGISTISMFEETNITSIKFNNTKSMKLVAIENMFFNSSKLTSLDLSSFNTSNLQNANSLFCGCTSLETLDLSNFDMSKATSYADMFRDCESLSTIKCKQTFKDWCITNQDMISLPTAMREGGSGTWEIVA